MEARPPLGVYLHWPYCARICPYCDFNVYKTRAVDAERWRGALVRDLEQWAARAGGRSLRSLYFGGGTPSLAPPLVIEGVIDACARLFGFEPDAEITLEANPTDAERSRFRAFAGAGVNRLSLGVQSFDDAALKFLGRDHDGAEARAAVETALAVFPRMSFDLIYALPAQTVGEWARELRSAIRMGAEHLSLYQLTIEPGTAFERAVTRGVWAPPQEGLAADLYDTTQETTAAAGLPTYEISNHSRGGAESRHNMLYWTGGDYIGVGPGAHGRITLEDGARLATETPLAPEAYLAQVESSGCGPSREEALGAEDRLVERLSMGLRLKEGLALTDEEAAQLGERLTRFKALSEDGLIVVDGRRLQATERGRRLLNAVLAEILA